MKELYQLVAIDKNNNEYIIELNNVNKKNKGTLSYIDYGTSYFKDSESLAIYLFEKGKIPTKDVQFYIKYNFKEEKRLSVLYNEQELRKILKDDIISFRRLGKEIFEQFILFFEDHFFCNYFFNLSYKERGLNKSDKINNKLYNYITEYYNLFLSKGKLEVNDSESFQYKLLLEDKIFDELCQYKQIRTMIILVKRYKLLKQINIELEYSSLNSSDLDEYEIPEEIDSAYKNGGMDEVYGIVDLDDLEAKKIRFK